LGIETPFPPTVSLAGLKSDGFAIHWKPGDDSQRTPIKYKLYVNGVNLGEIKSDDTDVIISGLKPDSGYAIRMFAVNASNFCAPCEPIYVQTLPEDSQDFYDQDHNPEATITPYKSLLNHDSSSATSTPLMREHSGSLSKGRQPASRRQTQSTPDPAPPFEDGDSEEIRRDLNSRLNNSEKARADLVKQMALEEQDFQSKHAAHQKELEDIQKLRNNQANTSKDLQKQINHLISEESTAKKNRDAAFKRLEKAQAEREKMKADTKRWEDDAPNIEAEIANIEKEQAKYTQEAKKKVSAIREEIAKESKINKDMEENLRQIVHEIRKKEEEIQLLDTDDYDSGLHMTDAEYHSRIQDHNEQINQLRESIEHVRSSIAQYQQYLDVFKTMPVLTSPRRQSLRMRAPSLGSARNHPFGTDSPTTLPFVSQTGVDPQMTQEDIDALTSGAMTSPSVVDGLLPAGLFVDDADSNSNLNLATDSPRIPGLGIQDTFDPGSPTSIPSRSPSAFTSPVGSTTNLPFGDSDGRSIRSATGSTRAGSGSKFASLFNIRRTNKKTSIDGPMLGSLNASHSFPRAENHDPLSRRRGSHSGMAGIMDNLNPFGRSSTTSVMESSSSSRFPWLKSGASNSSGDHLFSGPHRQSSFGSTHLSNEWGLAPPSTGWPGAHSRNPSLYASGFDSTEADDSPPLKPQQPIGTRPTSAHVSIPSTGSAAKLNPNAPTFKAFFAKSDKQKFERESKASKKEKKDKQRPITPLILLPTEVNDDTAETSPSLHRLSRDAMSLSTADYSSDAARDLDEATDLLSESQINHKESFMRKISRKSSAGFTTLAGRKGKKKGNAANPTDDTIPSAEVNDKADEILSKSINSALTVDDKGVPSPASGRFSFRRRGRRKADKGEKGGDKDEAEDVATLSDRDE
jgi:uncharacterized coiled-coil DUF342 family protein